MSREQSAICPLCECSKALPVLWDRDNVYGEERQALEAGTIVFAPTTGWLIGDEMSSRLLVGIATNRPRTVCLACQPAWAEIRRMGLQLLNYQNAKVNAVADSDFERAMEFKVLQDGLTGAYVDLVLRTVSDKT